MLSEVKRREVLGKQICWLVLRDVIAGSSTKKGVEEYLTLLSVSESCKNRGVDFLDFLRSGETDIAMFALRRRGREGSGAPRRCTGIKFA
jgi:hypothetical protein